MSQGFLGFQYEVEKKTGGMTSLAGLPLYIEYGNIMGMAGSLRDRLGGKNEIWTPDKVIMSLVMLNLAGGDCVDDLATLNADDGLCRIMSELQGYGLPRKQRRAARYSSGRFTGSFPSPSTVFRTLIRFHDHTQDSLREEGKAFIPESSDLLKSLFGVTKDFVASVQKRCAVSTATLDMDATLIETSKRDALYSYKGYKAYQPLNTYWAEQELIIHSEFRDGNVPAGFEQLRVFKEALDCLPEGVEQVFLRSDSAGYQQNLLKYCAEGLNERFGRIEFAIGADVTPEFRKAVREVPESDWISLGEFQQYAEVCFVPNWMAKKKYGPTYRYIAIRECLKQQLLPGMQDQLEFPFQTMETDGMMYKLTGLITNRTIPGAELIKWYRLRCGKSEQAHSIMKEDLAGGKLPSKFFGVNAAWWHIMLLSLNLNSSMKRLVLGGPWIKQRLKSIRFRLINLSGRVARHARSLIIRISACNPVNQLLIEARARMLELYQFG